jgi:DtxR family Mn-dependent transcriptional regulator
MSEFAPSGSLSPSVGDYLKAIWELTETDAASTKQIADRLSVAPASVSNMLGRLRERGLVEYEPYHGALLTARGRTEALRLVRRHRLIETFLLEHLGYSWQEVHEEAERLEHAVSDGFTGRLAEFLGYPDHDPHGDPIPATDGTMPPEDSRPLGEVEVGEYIVVSRVDHRDAAVLAYLEERELVPGRRLEVREVRALDGVVVVDDENGNAHALGEPLARSIFVRQAPERDTARTTK